MFDRSRESNMKWNVMTLDEFGRLKAYNIFEHDEFRKAIDNLFAENFSKDLFVCRLNTIVRSYFGTDSDKDILITTWPAYIDFQEINRIVAKYCTEQSYPKQLEIRLVQGHRLDKYSQLLLNWERFADYIWQESRR